MHWYTVHKISYLPPLCFKPLWSRIRTLFPAFVVHVCVSPQPIGLSHHCVCCVCDVCDYRTRETHSSDTSLTLSAGCQETPLQLFQQLFSAAGSSSDGRSFHTDDWHCRVWCGIFQGWYSDIFIIKAAKSAWLSSVFWWDSVLLWV